MNSQKQFYCFCCYSWQTMTYKIKIVNIYIVGKYIQSSESSDN